MSETIEFKFIYNINPGFDHFIMCEKILVKFEIFYFRPAQHFSFGNMISAKWEQGTDDCQKL